MNVVPITSLDAPEISVYSRLTDAQLRNRQIPSDSIFIAESPKVISVALHSGYQPISILCEERHIMGDAADIIAQSGDIPIYTGDRHMLAQLTGYTLTRGVLCAMHRPLEKKVDEIIAHARRIVIIHGVVDTTNIGAIFRSAAALGIDAILLTPDSCDPYNRRSIRVSMGSVFLLPWTWLRTPLTSLHTYGFKLAAMALRNDSIALDDTRLATEPKLAIVMGTEGDGLPTHAISVADYVIKIPMSHQVDSLNVAAAAAVAFWQLCR